jgi:hypothetical protein
MKIPSKIDKRQYNVLSKRNFKYLKEEINNVHHDLMIEANFLNDDWNPNNQYMEKLANENKDTIEHWQKETKKAFREFKSAKVKIERAYQKYLDSKK